MSVDVLYPLKNYVHRDIMKIVYYSIVYSYLQYAITCWGNTSAKLLKKLRNKWSKSIGQIGLK